MINEFLEEVIISKAGMRYSREKPEGGRYSRWGYNRGSVRIGDKKLRVDVLRVMDKVDESCVPLNSYDKFKEVDSPS